MGDRVFCEKQKKSNEMEDIVTQRMHEENAAFPLSQSQQNIWDLERAYSGTSINHITTSVRIQGPFRLDLLQKSIRLLLESDSSLRTRIEMREGKLVQYIVPMEEEAVPVFGEGRRRKLGAGTGPRTDAGSGRRFVPFLAV